MSISLITTNFASRLEDRIEGLAKTMVLSIPGYENADVHEMDEDIALRSQSDPPKPVIIINAQDTGRVRITPWRSVTLTIEVHADSVNTKKDAFNTYCAGLERWLRGTNLCTQLSSPTAGVYVGLAVPQQGTKPSNNGLLRKYAYAIDLKAVAVEHTN